MKKIFLLLTLALFLMTSCSTIDKMQANKLEKNRKECVMHHKKSLTEVKFKSFLPKLLSKTFNSARYDRWNRYHDYSGKKNTYLVIKKFKEDKKRKTL